jgi:CBS domain-containing protein
MHVHEILRAKGEAVETIGPRDTVRAAAQHMFTKRIGCLAVINADGRLAGLITERDIVRTLSRRGSEASTTRVQDVMNTRVPVCTPNDDVRNIMVTMTELRHRHLPVVRDGRIVGIVSIGDVVKHRLQDLELETHVLRDAYLAAH